MFSFKNISRVRVITPLIPPSGHNILYVCIVIRQRNVKMNLEKKVVYENRFHMSEGRVTDKCIIISRALPVYVDALRNNSAWALGLITRERMIYCIIVVIYARNIYGKLSKFKTQTLTCSIHFSRPGNSSTNFAAINDAK